MATYAQLNSSTQTQCGQQLRTFDVNASYLVRAYVRGQYFEAGNSYHPPVNSYTQDLTSYARFEYTGAPNSVYNNYLDGGVYTGNIIRSADVIDSISNVVRRTVDLIEGRIGNSTVNAYFCHASCHSSCHSSRGRR